MQVLKPEISLTGDLSPKAVSRMLLSIEKAYRVCYKSEGKMDEHIPNVRFINSKIQMGHESPLEHEKITVCVVCDRGVTHEVVRHRVGSYSQESTRYCNYAGTGLAVIMPGFWDPNSPIFREENPNWAKCFEVWKWAMEQAETAYEELIKQGATPQEARGVLPNSTKTEIVITYNLREWRHFLKLRTEKAAHPQMREVAIPLLFMFKDIIPGVFDDIEPYNGNDPRW